LVLIESVLTLLFAAENALEIGDGSVHPESIDILIDKATLPGSQVMEAIGQLVSTIDRDRVTRQLVEGTGCSSEGFLQSSLKKF
jgi:hypothetical protein